MTARSCIEVVHEAIARSSSLSHRVVCQAGDDEAGSVSDEPFEWSTDLRGVECDEVVMDPPIF
jgi:hypothetical protein